jgi:predicted nucleic acid-binding protein
MIVVDASVIVPLIAPHQHTAPARVAARHDVWTAPVLWRSEVRSALIKMIRAKSLSLDEAKTRFKQAELQLYRECSVQGDKVLEYSAKSQSSAYDCEYVVLADLLGLKLITTDEALIKHFPDTAVHLTDFVAAIPTKRADAN